MLGYDDGTLVSPSHFEPEISSTLSTKYLTWKAVDQRFFSLFLSSLTKKFIVIVVGLSTVCDVWFALKTMFSHHSKACELRLKDDLQLMKYDT